MSVSVQTEDFDLGREVAALTGGRCDIGAVASFVGLVRGDDGGQGVSAMILEHYPGMTEKALEEIVAQAHARWDLAALRVIHRYGALAPGEQIVLVIAAGAHRGEAFAACEFVMDFLKTRAPFWKKERSAAGDRWVAARASDDAALERWATGEPPG